MSPDRLAGFRFALARALWDASAGAGRDRTRALQLATMARDFHRTAKAEQDLVEVDAWLAARGASR